MGVTFLDEEAPEEVAGDVVAPTVTFLDDNEQVYREDTESVISAPVGMSQEEIEFYDNIQNGGKTKGNHFGMQLTRGFGGFFASTPQILASETIRDAEAFTENFSTPLSAGDFARVILPFGNTATGKRGGAWAKIQRAIGFDHKDNLERNERMLVSGQKLMDDNRAFLERNRLVKEEGDNIFFDLGSGVASIPTAIGMTVLTKNPAMATLFFGELQRSSTYIEAREKGFTPDQARNLSNVMGAVEGGIEAIGGKIFLEAVGADKVLKRIITRTVNEGFQEASQQAGEEIIGQGSGLRDVDIAGGIERVLYSGSIGMIIGAPTTSVVSIMERQARQEGVSEAQIKPVIEEFIKQRAEIEAAGASIIDRENTDATKDSVSEKKTAKILKDFTEGAEISQEQIDAAREEMGMPVGEELDTSTADGVDLQADIDKGRVDQLDEDIELVDAQIEAQASLINERTELGLPTLAAGKKLDRLISKREASDTERGEFLDKSEATPEVANQKVKIKGKRLRSIEAESKRKSVRALNSGFRQGKKLAATNIQAAQKSLRKTILSSGLNKAERDSFVTQILDLKTPEQLANKLPAIQQRIEAKLQKRQRADTVKRIGAKLKKFKSQPAKTTKGKLSPETNAAIDTASKAFALSKDAAAEKLAANTATDVAPSPLIALENSILALKADSKNSLLSDIEGIENQIDGLIEEGRSEAADRVIKQLRLDKEMKDEFIELSSIKTKSALKPETTVHALLKNLESGFINQSGVFRMKVKNALTGAIKDNEGRVDTFIKSISLTAESRVFEKGKADTTKQFVKKVLARAGFKNETKLFKYLHKTSGDIVVNEMASFKVKNEKTGKVELVRKRLKMTRSEARKRFMELQDEQMLDVLQSPEANGYTQEIINKITYALDDVDLQIAKGQLDFYEEYYERINETYKKVYGINLPKVEFYSPIRRKFEDGSMDEFMSGINYRGGVAPNSLKSRTPSVRPLEQLSDVTTLYSHMAEMEYFIAFSEKVGRLNRVMKSTSVQSALEENITDAMRKSLNRDLDYFAKKGIDQAKAGEKIITTLARNFSLSVLGAKPQVGFKQLTSFVAYADDVSWVDFSAGISEMAKNPKKALTVLRESELWINRGLNIDNDFQDALNDKHFLNLASRFPKFTEVMMLPIKYGDKAAIAIGGYARYSAQRKAGMSHAEALADFESKTASTQQSTDIDQQSEIQRSKGIVRLVSQFMSAPNALMRAEYDALAVFIAKGGIKGTGKKQFGKKMFIYHFLIPQLFTLMANGLTFDEEDQARALILGSLNGWLIWGDALEALVSFGVSGDYFEPEIRHPADFIDSLLKSADKFGKEGVTVEDFLEGSKAIEKSLDGLGKLTGVPARTLYNDMVGVGKVLNGDTTEGGAYMLGYSPWIVKNKIIDK